MTILQPVAALTCCCPLPRRPVKPADPPAVSPAAWQQIWAEAAYAAWCGEGLAPPVIGESGCLNLSDVPFRPPTADTVIYSAWPALPPTGLAAIWALGWLDRVDAPIRWLRQAGLALAPGGLLACSFATWDAEGEDCAIGAARRKRIYSPLAWRELALDHLPKLGFSLLGRADWRYQGHACGDHSMATIVAVRRAG